MTFIIVSLLTFPSRLPGSEEFPQSKFHCRQPDSYLNAFLNLLEDDIIQDFLWIDGCFKLADKVRHRTLYT